METWAGLRPGRTRIRLEREDKVIGGRTKKVGLSQISPRSAELRQIVEDLEQDSEFTNM